MNLVLPALLLPCLALPANAEESKYSTAFAISDYRHVEATDFFMNPGSYLGKPVEFRQMLCTRVTGQGFSCSTLQGKLTVLAPALVPDAEKKIITERCAASDPLYQQRCKRTIRLVVSRIAGERGRDYSQQRLIIRADIIEAVPLALDSSDD